MKILILLLLLVNKTFANEEYYSTIVEPVFPEYIDSTEYNYTDDQNYAMEVQDYNQMLVDDNNNYDSVAIQPMQNEPTFPQQQIETRNSYRRTFNEEYAKDYINDYLSNDLQDFNYLDNISFDDLPITERTLIIQAIREYNYEKELYNSEFTAAILDVTYQKKVLEAKLQNTFSTYGAVNNEAQIIALNTVINEKDSMLYNLEKVKYQREQKLFEQLKLQVGIILNRWVRSNIKTNPKYVEQILLSIIKK